MYRKNPGEFPARRSASRPAFTLVELLVVIGIIALLVAIAAPSLNKAYEASFNTKTIVRITELDNGARAYALDHNYFPGQQYDNQLTSTGSYTGSQVLAACLFCDQFVDDGGTPRAHSITYVSGDFNIQTGDPVPLPKYATVDVVRDDSGTIIDRKSDVFDPQNINTNYSANTRPCSVSDRFGIKPMAILYFPARIGVSDLSQYEEDDNADYLVDDETFDKDVDGNGTDDGWKNPEDGTDQGTFSNYIKDRRFEGDTSDTPYRSGEFLLIGAGLDRLYGTSDDLKNGW